MLVDHHSIAFTVAKAISAMLGFTIIMVPTKVTLCPNASWQQDHVELVLRVQRGRDLKRNL